MPNYLTLQTQMRSGTHFMCRLFHDSYGARLFWRDVEPMTPEDIRTGLSDGFDQNSRQATTALHVWSCHYYHQIDKHPEYASAPRVVVFANPFDSFWSDFIVFSDDEVSAAPSRLRNHENKETVFVKDSPVWNKLFPYMQQNADWLTQLCDTDKDWPLLRYEDIIDNFDAVSDRLVAYLGAPLAPFTPPWQDHNRLSWQQNYRQKYDLPALKAMWILFEKPMQHFYPEQSRVIKGLLDDTE